MRLQQMEIFDEFSAKEPVQVYYIITQRPYEKNLLRRGALRLGFHTIAITDELNIPETFPGWRETTEWIAYCRRMDVAYEPDTPRLAEMLKEIGSEPRIARGWFAQGLVFECQQLGESQLPH